MNALEDRLRDAKAIPILEIAARLGIEGLRRTGREHVGPCPVCGGKDRFSINDASGVFNCRICARGGDQVALVEHVLGVDFKSAIDWIDGGAVSVADAAAQERRRRKWAEAEKKKERAAQAYRDRATDQARAMFRAAVDGRGTLAETYLAARGIRLETWPPSLRFIAAHKMYGRAGDRFAVIHEGPAMIAAVQNPFGRITAVHQTWLDPDRPGQKARIRDRAGDPVPAKKVRGSKKGGAIRFTRVGGTGVMVMGEGIETTLSVMVSGAWPGACFWAGVDLDNMGGKMIRLSGLKWSGLPDLGDTRAFVPPEEIRKLVYLQDGDSAPAMTRAKLEAGLRRAGTVRRGVEGLIAPAPAGQDFNDLIKKKTHGASDDDEGQ